MAARLILTADDFGLSAGVNEAVARLSDSGVITSASLMVTGEAAAEAVRLARERPALQVGLHLVLVHGRAALPRERLPHLAPAGEFPRNCSALSARILASPALRREVRDEVAAQFDAFAKTGLQLSHVDGHLHFHSAPWVADLVLRECITRRVPRVRVPQDDFELYCRLDPLDAARWKLHARWFDLVCPRMRRAALAGHLVVATPCYGFFRSHALDEEYLVRLAGELPEGLAELHCHPDDSTPAGRQETRALLSPRFRAALQARGVQLG